MNDEAGYVWHQDLATVRERFPLVTHEVLGHDWCVRDTLNLSGEERPTLILLPGSLGSADVFFKQMLALVPEIRCLAVDYPSGSSAALADGLAALMDRLHLQRTCVLGSSLAGYWLQWFGANHPSRIASLILSSAFSDGKRLSLNPLFDRQSLTLLDGAEIKSEWLTRLAGREPDDLRNILLELLAHAQSGDSLRERLLHAANALPAPVIGPGVSVALIACNDDPLIDPETRRELADRYPGAFRLTLATGGHYPHVTQPDVFTAFVKSICSVHT